MEAGIRRAREGWDRGAREICVQAGLPPKMDGYYYVELTKAIKREMPDMHIHGFSPEEVLYGAVPSRGFSPDYVPCLEDTRPAAPAAVTRPAVPAPITTRL